MTISFPRVTCWLAVFFLLAILGAQEDPAPGAEKIEVPEGGTNAPMGSLGGRPLVDLMIDGKGPYRFILDTGASLTVIGEDLKKELALTPVAGTHAAAPGGGAAEVVKLANVRIGDAVLAGLPAAIVPLLPRFGGDNGPRGVLSAASLPGYLLILDYPNKRIGIRKGTLPPPDSSNCFQYTAEQMLPGALVRVAGTNISVHVDSGSPFALTLPTKYLKELPLESAPRELRKARTPHGEYPVWAARVKGGVELGKFKVTVDEVFFSDISPVPGPPTGNIGYKVLDQFLVTLDSKNRRIRFEQ
jgi:hypothetical protein